MDRYRLPLQRQHCSCCIGYPGHETDERPDKQGSHAGVQQVCPFVLVCIALNSCGREQSPVCSPAPSPLPARRALDRVEGATRGLNLLQERLRQVGRTPVRCAAVTKVCTRWRTAGPGRSRRASAASPPSPASCRGRRRGGARQPVGQTVRPPDKPRNTIRFSSPVFQCESVPLWSAADLSDTLDTKPRAGERPQFPGRGSHLVHCDYPNQLQENCSSNC